MPAAVRDLRLPVGDDDVAAVLVRPADADCLLVLGHGAGAGMHHPFMETMAKALAQRRMGTLRYQFPYMDRGGRRPDHRSVLVATVRAAVDLAGAVADGLPLLAGGKSMGGRMTSLAASEQALPGVRGLVFLGFPLHAAGRSGVERAAHLASVSVPMLFLQGTRDRLAEMNLIRPVCAELGDVAELVVIEGGDHSFHVLKRSGRTDEEVIGELAESVRGFAIQRV